MERILFVMARISHLDATGKHHYFPLYSFLLNDFVSINHIFRDPVQGESNTFTTYPVHCVDFRPNGEFATGGGDGSICLWNKETRNRVSNLTHFKNTNAVVDLKYDKTVSQFSINCVHGL